MSTEKFIPYLELLEQNKCKDIAVFHVAEKGALADYILVATLPDTAAVKRLADELMLQFEMLDFPEGYSKGEWVIFDQGEILIHVFVPEKREKYNLDKLWQNEKLSFEKSKKTKK